MVNILFLDLGVCYMDGLILWKFTELYTIFWMYVRLQQSFLKIFSHDCTAEVYR